VVLAPNGAVACWGEESDGEIGDGHYFFYDGLPPTIVPGLTGAVTVSAGGTVSCAQKADGTTLCWGEENGTPKRSRKPVPPQFACP
jgi:hypothetical protein